MRRCGKLFLPYNAQVWSKNDIVKAESFVILVTIGRGILKFLDIST